MKKLIILSVLALGFFSCSDDGRLEADSLTNGPKIVGFQNSVENVTYFEDVGAVTVEVPVILYGLGDGTLNSDVTFNYEVNTALSTATPGMEYTMSGTGGTVTIPAGSEFVNIPITVNTGSLNPTMATKLVLTLTSTDESVVAGEQYKQITVNFVGCVSSIAEGGYTVQRLPGSNIGPNTVYQDVVTLVGTNEFKTAHTPPFLGSNEVPGVPAGFIFEDVCGEIIVPVQDLFGGYYPNDVQGDGEVINANVFEIELLVANGYITFLRFTKN